MFLYRRVQSFVFGLKLPFRALALILEKKSLLGLSLLPLVITGGLYFYVILGLQEWASDQIRALIATIGWNPDHWIATGFYLLTQLIILVASAMTFAFASSIVASPLNDYLAERTEKFVEPRLPKASGRGVRYQLRLVGVDLLKTIASTAAAIAALLFSWVPVLNLFAFILSFLLICFQYTSYPQTRRGVGIREGAGFLWRHVWACTGFGATVAFLFAMPLVSVLALPVAGVGGTLLVARASSSLPSHFALK